MPNSMAPISFLGDWFKDIAFRHQRANPLPASRREHTIAAMSEEAPNLVLEHLLAIRSELHETREEQREQRTHLRLDRAQQFVHDARNSGDGLAARSNGRPPRSDRGGGRPRR